MKNLRLAIRSLLHFRFYSVVNMLGLTLALTCVIVIFRYVHGEATVDRFHEKIDRTYLLTYETLSENSDIPIRYASLTSSTPEIAQDPAVARTASVTDFQDEEIRVGERNFNARILVTDSNFLQILDFPILTGPRWISVSQAYITPAYAQKVFGDEDPIGQVFRYSDGREMTVAGIVRNYPERSVFDFDVILPREMSERWMRADDMLVLLHPGQDYRELNEKYKDVNESLRVQLFPLKEVYFDLGIADFGSFRHGKKQSVTALLLVGMLILFIGVINFINIYTSVVLRRGREFGMKKVFGAPGRAVFGQLLLENTVMIGFSLVMAFALIEMLNPVIKNLLGFDQLPFRSFDLLLALSLFVLIPLVTTQFPFCHYNYSAPITALRSVGKTGGKSPTRKILLCFQYLVTIVMIVVSLFFMKQLHGMLSADPGFETADMIQTRFLRSFYNTDGRSYFNTSRPTYEIQDEIGQALDASPLIERWTNGSHPVLENVYTYKMRGPGGEWKDIIVIRMDQVWMELFGISATEGRIWNDEIDDMKDNTFIITESAKQAFGFDTIEGAVVEVNGMMWVAGSANGPVESARFNSVIGVIPDLKLYHIGEVNFPVVMYHSTGSTLSHPTIAKIAPGKRQEAIEFLKQLHAETVGGEFSYTFIEDDVKALYAEDRKVATVYAIFTVIAILISILGLFSLSLFDVQQRYKEIAIRKVNGATTSVIVGLLLRKYLVLLGISFVIAVPIAWYAIQRYLEGFAYKTAVSWWLFAVALLITAGVSLLTLIHQTRKAASANPADVIRNE